MWNGESEEASCHTDFSLEVVTLNVKCGKYVRGPGKKDTEEQCLADPSCLCQSPFPVLLKGTRGPQKNVLFQVDIRNKVNESVFLCQRTKTLSVADGDLLNRHRVLFVDVPIS